MRIDAAVSRYEALRLVYGLVRRLGDQAETADGFNWYAATRNTEDLWPAITGLLQVDPADAPWSKSSTRDQIAWWFANGAELWLPTAQEQTQRWLESPLGKRAEQARTNRANLNGYRALGEGARSGADRPMDERTAAVHERLFGADAGIEAEV